MTHTGQAAVNPGIQPCIEPLRQDRRFSGEAWQHWPYNLIYQSFLLTQQWWHNATTDIDGLSKEDERAISFVALIRPRCLDRRRVEFSGFDQGDGLVAPPDFVSEIGVLFPIAPWDRSSL